MHDLPKNLMEPWEASLTAVVKANRLALDNLQKLSSLQMDMLRTCVDLGFARLRAAADIKDAQDFLAFQAGQIDATISLSEKLDDEGKALADLGDGIIADCSRLTEDIVGRPLQPLQPPLKAA